CLFANEVIFIDITQYKKPLLDSGFFMVQALFKVIAGLDCHLMPALKSHRHCTGSVGFVPKTAVHSVWFPAHLAGSLTPPRHYDNVLQSDVRYVQPVRHYVAAK